MLTAVTAPEERVRVVLEPDAAQSGPVSPAAGETIFRQDAT